MAGEPKRRHSKARKRTRRASITLGNPVLILCSNCQQPVLPHIACKSCGFYAGKQIIQMTAVKVTKA